MHAARHLATTSARRALALALLVACGGAGAGSAGPGSSAPGGEAADESAFGPLEVGADHGSYRRVTDAPFLSLDHGNRWVHVYVNEVGVQPYLDGGDIPVGTVLVKTSVVTVDGRPSELAGPIFVMEKRAPGYAPAHGDWWYAIHWAEPPPAERAKYGGPVYWRGRSPRVAYCWECHDDYVNGLGGLVPSSLLPR